MRLEVGDKLTYEYDFGSTTTILLTVVSEISRVKQQDDIQLLGRNEPFTYICDFCGVPAKYVNVREQQYYCDECVEKEDEDGYSLPIVNSPRMGECGYDGELDKWTFNPDNYS